MTENNSTFFSSLIEKGQFRVDEDGHARLFGEYLFLIPPRTILNLQEELEERLGKEEMEDLLVELGEDQVKGAVHRHSDRYDIEGLSRQKFFNYMEDIHKVLGWGDIQITDLDSDAGEWKVEVMSPVLPAVFEKAEGEAEAPICHYLKGILKKGFEFFLDGKSTVNEVQCAAVSGDRCIFEGRIKD